jgi:hypothetical protein
VDSSESSSDDASDKEPKEETEELRKILSDLIRENKELEVSVKIAVSVAKEHPFTRFSLVLQQTRSDLCSKIQEERASCVSLRVQIRVEQERKKMARRRNNCEAV